MAIYTVGRRRVMIALLLTSALLLTLDLRGNPVIDRARDVFGTVMQPVEAATGVVTTPVERTWKAISDYDDLERENQELQDQVDRLIGTQAAAESSILEYQELQSLFNLPSLSGIDTEVAKVIGRSANNLDLIIEIDKGRSSGISVGMPVVNQAGLIGKVTNPVNETTARVMLITDSRYTVSVKLLAGFGIDTDTTVATTPSGLTEDEVLDEATTTTTPPSVNPDTTLPGATPVFPGGTTTTTVPEGVETTTTTVAADASAVSTSTTSTTTTTIPPETVEKEFGALEGRGRGFLPQVRFLQDNPTLAVLEVGDLVETAGGAASLAPPGIPIGRVVNRADRSGSGGPLLDVEPHADLDQLGFVRVVLYKPLAEVEQ